MNAIVATTLAPAWLRRASLISVALALGVSAPSRAAAQGSHSPQAILKQQIIAPDGQAGDSFGVSISLDGQTAAIGAIGVTVGGNAVQGAVYIYHLQNGVWTEIQKLVTSDGEAYDDFGNGVALQGDTLLIGAPGAVINGNAAQGAVYVFTNTGGLWTQTQKLLASDGAGSNEFGTSVAQQGNTALIGAIQLLNGAGAAYIFNRTGDTWTQTQELVAADGSDTFGDAVALDSGIALIGAQQTFVNGRFNAGAAFIFTQVADGTWKQTATLTGGGGINFGALGASVALEKSTALLGAPGAPIDGQQVGAAYIYTLDSGRWQLAQRLIAADGATGDAFGSSVALQGGKALIGADDSGNNGVGQAYLFTDDTGTFLQEKELVSANAGRSQALGRAAAASADYALFGAPGATVNGNQGQGAVYVAPRTILH